MNKLTYLLLLLLTFSFANTANSSTNSATNNTIRRVRIDFTTPLNYTKQILIGFTSNNIASDGIDYGYDALNFQDLDDDLNWVIEDENYVIQGVGEYANYKQYPLGLFLTNTGEFQISLNSLENFETEINVYIYDALLDTFTSIVDGNYTNSLPTGDYQDRFYVTFSDNINVINFETNSATLSTSDINTQKPTIQYLKSSKELNISTNNSTSITGLKLYNLNGQEISSTTNINKNNYKLPINNVSGNYVIVNVYTNDKTVTKKLLLIH